MKPDLLKFTFCLLAAGALLTMPSCIDQDYSVKNIDTSMTVLPGLTFPLNSTVEIAISDFVKGFNQDCLHVDQNGNYEMKTETYSETFYLDGSYEVSEFTLDISKEFTFWDSLILPELKDGSYSMHCPIMVNVENPTDLTFFLSATVHTNDMSKSVRISDMEVTPGSNSIELKGDDIMAFFNPFESPVVVSDIKLTYRKQGATKASSTTAADYNFSFSVSVPLRFMPGDGFEYKFYSDIFRDSDFLRSLSNLDFNVKSMSVKTSVDSRIPFEIDLQAERGMYENMATMTFDGPIAAGNTDASAKTDMEMSVVMPGGLYSIENLMLHIKAVVPEKYSNGILLNERQKLVLNFDSAEFKEGIML